MVKAWESHVVLRSQSRDTPETGFFCEHGTLGYTKGGGGNGLGTQLGMVVPCGPSEPDRTRLLSWMEASFWRLGEEQETELALGLSPAPVHMTQNQTSALHEHTTHDTQYGFHEVSLLSPTPSSGIP